MMHAISVYNVSESRLKNRAFWLLLLSVTSSATSTEVYIWVDDSGVQNFSDTPHPDADKRSIPSIKSDASSTVSVNTPSALQPKSKNNAERVAPPIINTLSPRDGETIRSNNGDIEINITLSRALSDTEQLQLLMDGQPIGAPSTKTVWQLNNLDRGTHRYSIQIVGSGKIIASSSVVTVYLHRASVN